MSISLCGTNYDHPRKSAYAVIWPLHTSIILILTLALPLDCKGYPVHLAPSSLRSYSRLSYPIQLDHQSTVETSVISASTQCHPCICKGHSVHRRCRRFHGRDRVLSVRDLASRHIYLLSKRHPCSPGS